MNESVVKNCRILIKNAEDGQIIADTKITRFDSQRNLAYIRADSLKERKPYNVSAFIFAKKCLYEFSGTIRGVLAGAEVEVLLGKSTEKESRAKTRYPVAIEGNIDGIIIEGQMVKLRKPIHIQTINMSANGILMKADSGSFDIGDCFCMNLAVENSEIQLTCKVVRIQSSNMQTAEYGCRIREIWRGRETIQENEK